MACSNKKVALEVSHSMIKEVELHIAHKAQVEIIAEALEEQNGAKVWEPGESGVAEFDEAKSDVNVEAKVEVSGVKEVMQLDGLTMMKMNEQSRCANWDPGEPVDAKAQMEMSDAKEEKIFVKNGKVGLSRDVNWKVFYYAMALNNVVLFNTEALLIVLFLSRFVNGFRGECPIELSDYG